MDYLIYIETLFKILNCYVKNYVNSNQKSANDGPKEQEDQQIIYNYVKAFVENWDRMNSHKLSDYGLNELKQLIGAFEIDIDKSMISVLMR